MTDAEFQVENRKLIVIGVLFLAATLPAVIGLFILGAT